MGFPSSFSFTWSNKARTGNLKQFVETVNYLTENKLLTLEDLQERLSSVSEEFEALSGSMKKKSARIKELQELIREGENYQRLKPVHTGNRLFHRFKYIQMLPP